MGVNTYLSAEIGKDHIDATDYAPTLQNCNEDGSCEYIENDDNQFSGARLEVEAGAEFGIIGNDVVTLDAGAGVFKTLGQTNANDSFTPYDGDKDILAEMTGLDPSSPQFQAYYQSITTNEFNANRWGLTAHLGPKINVNRFSVTGGAYGDLGFGNDKMMMPVSYTTADGTASPTDSASGINLAAAYGLYGGAGIRFGKKIGSEEGNTRRYSFDFNYHHALGATAMVNNHGSMLLDPANPRTTNMTPLTGLGAGYFTGGLKVYFGKKASGSAPSDDADLTRPDSDADGIADLQDLAARETNNRDAARTKAQGILDDRSAAIMAQYADELAACGIVSIKGLAIENSSFHGNEFNPVIDTETNSPITYQDGDETKTIYFRVDVTLKAEDLGVLTDRTDTGIAATQTNFASFEELIAALCTDGACEE